MSNLEDGFKKFEELAKAIKVQQKHIEELERSFVQKNCPFRQSKCTGTDCSWFMICLNSNRKAFHDILS